MDAAAYGAVLNAVTEESGLYILNLSSHICTYIIFLTNILKVGGKKARSLFMSLTLKTPFLSCSQTLSHKQYKKKPVPIKGPHQTAGQSSNSKNGSHDCSSSGTTCWQRWNNSNLGTSHWTYIK